MTTLNPSFLLTLPATFTGSSAIVLPDAFGEANIEAETHIIENSEFLNRLFQLNPKWSVLLTRDENAINHDASPVIPIEELDDALIDFALYTDEPPEDILKKVGTNLLFYGSWFPAKTRAAFEAAYDVLQSQNELCSTYFMVLEYTFAPNQQHFMEWITQTMADFNTHLKDKNWISDGECAQLTSIMSLAKEWQDKLAEPEKKQMRALFTQTEALVKREDFSFPTYFGVLAQFFFSVTLGSLSDYESPKSEEDLLVNKTLFEKEAEEILQILDQQVKYEGLNARQAKLLWTFFNTACDSLALKRDFWNQLSCFLIAQPQFVADFLSQKQRWLALVPKKADYEGTETPADYYLVYKVYRELIYNQVVPEAYKRAAYLTVLEFRHEDLSVYEALESVAAIEEKLMIEELLTTLNEGQNRVHCFTEDLGWKLFKNYIAKNGVENTIQKLKDTLPEKETAKMELSFQVMRLFGEPDEDIAEFFLKQYQEKSLRDYNQITEDPLWLWMWNNLNDHNLTEGHIHPFVEYPWEKEGTYYKALEHVPQILLRLGFEELVKDFYFSNHPYARVYALDPSIRPTGKGFSYVSIDDFFNPREQKHADKKRARVLRIDTPDWIENDEYTLSHGLAMSSLAVGDSLGLAPHADLYVTPLNQSQGLSLPLMIAKSLEAAIEARKKDPSIRVVGMSLGLEVPHNFRDLVEASELYQRLVTACETLHSMGIAIIVSAGNNGDADSINMLGFLPHVELVGAMNSSSLSESTSDDYISHYSTGADQANPISYYAHADPVLGLVRKDKLMWMAEGGTSSAQPHASGLMLLMMEVNPTLSLEAYYQIIQETACHDCEGNEDNCAINPERALVAAAHLSGSTYEGDRLEALTQGLLGISSLDYQETVQFGHIQKK